MKPDKTKVIKLRMNLTTIRNLAGWSADNLAEMLDVTRQTILNIENGKTAKMTVVQYLAIRYLIQNEIDNNNNKMLSKAVDFFVDRDDLSEEDLQKLREQISSAIKNVGSRAGAKAGSAEAAKVFTQTLGEMRLSDIPQEQISKGQKLVEQILQSKIKEDN